MDDVEVVRAAITRETGAEIAAPCGFVFELRGGLITSLRTYTEPAEAVRAAGA